MSSNFIKPKLRKLFHRTHLFFYLLSFDIVLGAVGSYAFACAAVGQRINMLHIVILALAVWVIYLADHLLDNQKNFYPGHKKHIEPRFQKILFILLLVTAAFAAFLAITFLPGKVIFSGIVLSVFTGLYFAAQHSLPGSFRKFFPKEFIITFIYLAAVWMVPLINTGFSGQWEIFAGIHFLVIFCNVLLFSWFEAEEDKSNAQLSVFSVLPIRALKIVILLLGITTAALSIYFAIQHFELMLVPLLIALIYTTEILYSDSTFVRNHYKLITDGAFLLFLVYAIV